MAVKLHRDRVPLRIDGHSCWRVEKALIDAGIPYEVVYEPALPRSRRSARDRGDRPALLPAIEFEDGRWLYESSAELAARIRAGRLFDRRTGGLTQPRSDHAQELPEPGPGPNVLVRALRALVFVAPSPAILVAGLILLPVFAIGRLVGLGPRGHGCRGRSAAATGDATGDASSAA